MLQKKPAFADEKGAVQFFEASILYPLAALSAALLLILLLVFWSSIHEEAAARRALLRSETEENRIAEAESSFLEESGKGSFSSAGPSGIRRSGLYPQRLEGESQRTIRWRILSLLSLQPSLETESRTVVRWMQSARTLWDLQCLVQWMGESFEKQ